MQTIEEELHIARMIAPSTLQIVHLADSDVVDINSDINVSYKIIDEIGNTVISIECMPLDIWPSDDENAKKGCFIRKFQYTDELTDLNTLNDFFSGFLTSVRFSMFFDADGRIQNSYQYIWIETPNEEETIRAVANCSPTCSIVPLVS